MADDQGKKLIIDDDWKQEAQKEKEILADKEKQEKASPEGAGSAPSLPPAIFSSLVSMLGTQAFYAMGFIRTREDEEPIQDLNMAQYNIDLLGVLQDKTQNNLSEEEHKILDETLQQLRMAFVQASNPSPK
ncbi:MAG: DUF1844 domain-containing protein [Phycisphaeraceae bacterium]|nr:DUF1844 domain-containing protein [Phycisphaeraceae bacterium]